MELFLTRHSSFKNIADLVGGAVASVILFITMIGGLYAHLFGNQTGGAPCEAEASQSSPERLQELPLGSECLSPEARMSTPLQDQRFGLFKDLDVDLRCKGYRQDSALSTPTQSTPTDQTLFLGVPGTTPPAPLAAHPFSHAVPARSTSPPPSPTPLRPRNLDASLLSVAKDPGCAPATASSTLLQPPPPSTDYKDTAFPQFLPVEEAGKGQEVKDLDGRGPQDRSVQSIGESSGVGSVQGGCSHVAVDANDEPARGPEPPAGVMAASLQLQDPHLDDILSVLQTPVAAAPPSPADPEPTAGEPAAPAQPPTAPTPSPAPAAAGVSSVDIAVLGLLGVPLSCATPAPVSGAGEALATRPSRETPVMDATPHHPGNAHMDPSAAMTVPRPAYPFAAAVAEAAAVAATPGAPLPSASADASRTLRPCTESRFAASVVAGPGAEEVGAHRYADMDTTSSTAAVVAAAVAALTDAHGGDGSVATEGSIPLDGGLVRRLEAVTVEEGPKVAKSVVDPVTCTPPTALRVGAKGGKDAADAGVSGDVKKTLLRHSSRFMGPVVAVEPPLDASPSLEAPGGVVAAAEPKDSRVRLAAAGVPGAAADAPDAADPRTSAATPASQLSPIAVPGAAHTPRAGLPAGSGRSSGAQRRLFTSGPTAPASSTQSPVGKSAPAGKTSQRPARSRVASSPAQATAILTKHAVGSGSSVLRSTSPGGASVSSHGDTGSLPRYAAPTAASLARKHGPVGHLAGLQQQQGGGGGTAALIESHGPGRLRSLKSLVAGVPASAAGGGTAGSSLRTSRILAGVRGQ